MRIKEILKELEFNTGTFPRQAVENLAHGCAADPELLGQNILIEDLARCVLEKEYPALDYPIDIRVHFKSVFL